MEGCQLHQTNYYRFDQNPIIGLGFSSDGGFFASDQLIYLDPRVYQTSSSSSHSSDHQVSMDDEWSPNFLNHSNNMQVHSTRSKFSDEQLEQQPWYGANQSTDDHFIINPPYSSTYDPYTFGQFEAARNSDEQYSMPQFDDHHQLAGNPNDHQSFFPTSSSTKQQTMLKSSKTSSAAVKRKYQAKKKSDQHSIEKQARTEPNSSPGISYSNKVGKEKMGDRITTLQRLVSPFGKGDTASVLSECIEYIRFLHEQVSVLSTSHMTEKGAQMQHFQDLDECFYEDCVRRSSSETGLRGRGLCIVPISSTFFLKHETPTDFLTPTLCARSDYNLQN